MVSCRISVGFLFMVVSVFERTCGDCWGKYRYYSGREGTPCSNKETSSVGDESCGFLECDTGYFCQAGIGMCVPCNNSNGEYPNFPGYYSSPGISYNGNDCQLRCPIGYTIQLGGDKTLWYKDTLSLKWKKYTVFKGQCRLCEPHEACSFDVSKSVCGGQDARYFGWMGKLLNLPVESRSAIGDSTSTSPFNTFDNCLCPPGFISNFSADNGFDCGSQVMDDGSVLRYSCCDFVGYLLYTDGIGVARKCTRPWPECISSDSRGLWQYLTPCTNAADRRCAPCDNPRKPNNSHYTESPRVYPGIFECRWVCDAGFFELGWACLPCTACGTGKYALTPCNGTADTVCSACPPPPTGAYFPVPGSCAWNCTADFTPAAGGCAPCPVQCGAGFYRRDCGPGGGSDPSCRACSNSSCVPCTNRPADRIARFFTPDGTWAEATVRSRYTGPGSWRAGDCSWTCQVGYYGHAELGCAACTNRPNPLLPVTGWGCGPAGNGGTVCSPRFASLSYYTGPGGFEANDCPWSCAANYTRVGDDCVNN